MNFSIRNKKRNDKKVKLALFNAQYTIFDDYDYVISYSQTYVMFNMCVRLKDFLLFLGKKKVFFPHRNNHVFNNN